VKERIRLRFARGRTSLTKGGFATHDSYRHSLLHVLQDVSNVVRGWSNQYAFCDAEPMMLELDQFVDEELSTYIGVYGNRRKRAAERDQRRMLGVRLFTDGKRAPIYPLGDAA
jgi:hypothetical protein